MIVIPRWKSKSRLIECWFTCPSIWGWHGMTIRSKHFSSIVNPLRRCLSRATKPPNTVGLRVEFDVGLCIKLRKTNHERSSTISHILSFALDYIGTETTMQQRMSLVNLPHQLVSFWISCLEYVFQNGGKYYFTISGLWFGTFFIFPYIGNNHPNWLIFFRGVQTTNQICVNMIGELDYIRLICIWYLVDLVEFNPV